MTAMLCGLRPEGWRAPAPIGRPSHISERAVAQARQDEALRLREEGATYAVIAERLGYAEGGAVACALQAARTRRGTRLRKAGR